MRSLVITLLLIAVATVGYPTAAHAACAGDPDQLWFRQMIREGTTGDEFYDRMILGRVERIRDPGPDGGRMIAVIDVRAHPTGFVPERARVRFLRYFPDGNHGIDVGSRWVFLAHRKADRSFRSDYYQGIEYCGKSQPLTRSRYRALLELAHRFD